MYNVCLMLLLRVNNYENYYLLSSTEISHCKRAFIGYATTIFFYRSEYADIF